MTEPPPPSAGWPPNPEGPSGRHSGDPHWTEESAQEPFGGEGRHSVSPPPEPYSDGPTEVFSTESPQAFGAGPSQPPTRPSQPAKTGKVWLLIVAGFVVQAVLIGVAVALLMGRLHAVADRVTASTSTSTVSLPSVSVS